MKKILTLTFLTFLFILIAYLVLENKTISFDTQIYNIVTYNKNNFLTGFYKFITFFASGIMILSITLVMLIVLKNKKYGIFTFLNVFGLFILNITLKLIFMRDRPQDLMIISETGYSFPSGHAMASLGFYGFIIFVINQMNLDKKTKKIFTILLIILIILIGISRIYLGVHYPSDVIAGYIVSSIYLILYIPYIKKYLKGVSHEKHSN